MTKDELVNGIYQQIVDYLADGDSDQKIIYDWETKYGPRIKHLIRSFLHNAYAIDQPNSNEPIPPPNWQSIHIGDGIFVEEENPELNCEVG